MPSEPTVDEVRELLKRAEKITDVLRDEWRHGYVPLSEKELGSVAALCRHFLASQQPMTAGEFAGLILSELAKDSDGYKKTGMHQVRAGVCSSIVVIKDLAAEHNITIVEPKK